MVRIDTVYQRVLALANKEQRGYITPQEFNLFANQAQMDIFEQYFYDRTQFGRIPGNNTMYADPIDILEEKIEIFHRGQTLGDGTSNIFNTNDLNDELYRLKQVRYNRTDGVGVKVEKTIHDKFQLSRNSPLTSPTLMRPIYYLRNTSIIVNPNDIKYIDVNYITKPDKVNWSSYDLSGNPLYDSFNSVDFELHPSEETKLVIKILGLAGITLKDPALYQIAGAEDNKNIQQEKQ